MGKSWTEEQQQVIDLRDRSLLVSAAAGSGKTAVLVERIIKKITDESRPVDIDQLLVVTFTKAAASEMRERIMAAVDDRLSMEPENLHLQRQKMLIPTAFITTIDSFCMRVLREHFDAIDLDPGFRVGDPQEMILLKQDVAEKLLEDSYEKSDPEFIQFVDTYSSGKLDKGLTDWILKIYEFSQSYPWPDLWLSKALKLNPGNSKEITDENPIIQLVMEEAGYLIKEIADSINQALELVQRRDGPYLYEPMLISDIEQLEKMLECDDYGKMYDLIQSMTWERLSSRKQEADPDIKEMVKRLRKEAKDLMEWLKKNYFSEDISSMLEKEQRIFPGLKVLIHLTEEFSKRFQEEKEQRNLIDFSDLEHLALKILLGEEHKATAVAKSYREQFEEIMCDEYQDSNQVQETLLNSISREEEGHPNIFVVGDVKQSIYRFRLAEPEIFMKKYEAFTKEESSHQKIDLHKNFRSRACVLDSINNVFEDLMIPSVCGIVYDSDAALNPGLTYPETEHEISETSEWILVGHDKDKRLSKREAEAKAIGIRIRELTDPEKGLWVMDPASGQYRKADYGDIVILLRTVKNWTEDFVRVLKDMGIPAIGETSSGFFDTIEIQGILNMLRILDNPLQNIPMAAVMTSVIGQFSDEEMAKIRLLDRKKYLYDDMKLYLSEGEDILLKEKIQAFLDMYERFRKMKIHRSIEELIHEIYDATGYVCHMTALPGGELRRANLERLVAYAADFKNTSYRGLFHFLRYVDQLKEAKEDVGEALLPDDAGKTVRIMSIHKSKGLEYPICIVAGLGKTMNFTESRSRIVVHSRYGVAADGVDLSLRAKIHSLSRKVFARKLLQDQMGEEIRVLYVAMTRAREKLILIGTVEDGAKTLEKWEYMSCQEVALTYSQIMGASSYFDWIGPLLFSDGKMGASMGFEFRYMGLSDLAADEVREEIEDEVSARLLENYSHVPAQLQPLFDEVNEKLAWTYPKEWLTKLQGKMTVSELKKMAGESMTGAVLYPEEKKKKPADKDETLYMAQQKGTATHKIFELLPFADIGSIRDVEDFIHQCVEKEQIPAFWENLIPKDKIYDFCCSELGQRLALAQKNGHLFRERPFVMGIPASDVYPDANMHKDVKERILIQGVIDVYFEEEDGVVLMDYKTDRVPWNKAGEELLIRRYKTQLDYYQQAIEQITGKKVKDRILYSVIMNREIHC